MPRNNPNAPQPSIFLLENSMVYQGGYSHDLVSKHQGDIWRLHVDVWFNGCQIFTNVLMMMLKRILTNIAWKQLKDRVINSRQLAAEASKRVQEFRSTCEQLSQDLLEQCLPLLSQCRIERPTWKEEGLKDYLIEILKRVEIEYVVAVAEVGLSGNHSNSVKADILRTAKEVLDSRIEEAQAMYYLGVGNFGSLGTESGAWSVST